MVNRDWPKDGRERGEMVYYECCVVMHPCALVIMQTNHVVRLRNMDCWKCKRADLLVTCLQLCERVTRAGHGMR